MIETSQVAERHIPACAAFRWGALAAGLAACLTIRRAAATHRPGALAERLTTEEVEHEHRAASAVERLDVDD